ncbi:enoyl-CoA hydratase/isomerase family protein [Pontixanthobacter aquaemixtae]|uniref:enoyl-CoA hydratase/isomerase family protein n=1 Tax=Pontixanthobacter aquaemixtae TaxID=1958940 RepID=UPI002E274F33
MKLEDYKDKYGSINITRNDGVIELAMHTKGGPPKWGTTGKSLHADLPDAFLDVARDPENRVVILTGTGDSFITNFDMDDMSQEGQAKMWPRIYEEGVGLLNNLLAIPVPVIGAVNGPAFIHAELLVLSDIVLAAEHAEFADFAHVPGRTVPGDGVHVIWPMLLGPNRGRYFLLTGERIAAEEAKQLGVVGEVLAADGLLPRARELATQLAQLPLPVLRYTRQVLVHDLRCRMMNGLGSGLAHEALASVTAPAFMESAEGER